MVYRIYVEKRPEYAVEARGILSEIRHLLRIKSVTGLRLLNRYDVEGISEELFSQCCGTVFSEPQLDFTYTAVPEGADAVFATEFLPGQFDQRAASAAECIQLISQGERPDVQSARVFLLYGAPSAEELAEIKKYVINPVEAREASLAEKATLKTDYAIPTTVETLEGFTALDEAGLADFVKHYGLAMDEGDIAFCQSYFKSEHRDPTITEIRMIDTYWSDHCRHTTFGTILDDVQIEDETVKAAWERYLALRREVHAGKNKPVCLMDLGTIGGKYLKKTGVLKNMDESDEINACSVRITVDNNGTDEPWLLLFKNETHNHPTEIEPFGGAATCVGGAIRDPLSGRSYVYQAMRVTGAADPTVPVSATIAGKLPQRKLVTTAAAGYSSYGNQIGLATGQVSELYHPGYMAKRMEVGAVVGATPASHVRRECPAPGDKIILLGGRTGRDGIGGATGSSKAHNVESIEKDGAEVQKGNAPMERKLQRLFRRGDACRLIKRCNDFGAGGVSVAVGELADGLYIDLDMVTKKYDGLDGTELAISESQERMAVAVAEADVDEFMGYAAEENLEATVIAEVTCEPRVRMAWQGDAIVDLSREFLNSNGAPKFQDVHVPGQGIAPIDPESELAHAALEEFGSLDNVYESTVPMVPGAEEVESFEKAMRTLVSDLNVCSNKGLSERFDSTIGAATVLMPFGGTRQLTPAQAMVAKFPVDGETTTVSGMAWGFNPYIMEADQFRGAYLSVVESIARLVATGFDHRSAYLSFQEYFERLRDVPERWGKPMAAVLGALMAQVDLGVGAIGGKDSMSGSFEDLDVPPTLVSFAVAVDKLANVVSPEFKVAGSRVALIQPAYREDDLLPQTDSLLAAFEAVEKLVREGKALSVSTAGFGGLAEILFKACLGNKLGFQLSDAYYEAEGRDLFDHSYGCFVVELAEGTELPAAGGVEVIELGCTTQAYEFTAYGETLDMDDLQEAWASALEGVFPYRSAADDVDSPEELVPEERYRCEEEGRIRATYGGLKIARPRVVIPVFPGNNCEYDSARAFRAAGAEADIFVINNLTPENVAESTRELARRIRESQIVMIPGGFSGGDEPDGSAKFITAFFRAPEVTEAVRDLLQARDGLMLGICNGFQALIKLGLVPYGDIVDATADAPTLTFNQIGRHQSRLVRTRICSDLSPWLTKCDPDELYTVAISHGEGRFVANDDVLSQLREGGQIATQYVDVAGMPSMDLDVNPNGSVACIEGITSPDGRVFGKMGHVERRGDGLYKNVPGDKFMPLFESGVAYFA